MESTRIRIRTGGQTRTPPKSKRRRRPPSDSRVDRVSFTMDGPSVDRGNLHLGRRERTTHEPVSNPIEPCRVPDQTIHVERNDPMDRGRRAPLGWKRASEMRRDWTNERRVLRGRDPATDRVRAWEKDPLLGTGLLEPERRAVSRSGSTEARYG